MVKAYLEKNESSKASESTNATAEELEKKDEKKPRRRRTARSRVLYEFDATDLKMADRNQRILRSVGVFAAELALIFVVAISPLEIYGVIILFIAILFLLPSPVAVAPSKYKITKQGVLFNGQKVFPLQKKYKLRVNYDRKFISVRDRKGEVLKLYTTELEKVLKILNKLIVS